MKETVKPSIYYYTNIKIFLDKFLVGRWSNQCSVQKKFNSKSKYGYYPLERKVTTQDIFEHFYHPWKQRPGYVQGSLAFRPTVNNELKWVCFDIDNKGQKDEFIEKAIPALGNYGLDYILEHGGDTNDRCKVWIPMDVTIETARHLIFQIGEDVGLNFQDPKGEGYYDEIFGVNKIDFVIRFPLGRHIPRDKVFPIETAEGDCWDPSEFIKIFIRCRQPGEEQIAPLLRPLKFVRPERKKDIKPVDEEKGLFYYRSRGLKPPAPFTEEDLPQLTRPIFKNCQAANDVLDGIIRNNYLMDRIRATHPFGLAISGLCAFNDTKLAQRLKKKVTEGWEFFSRLVNEYRDRDDSKHQWESSWKTAEESFPERVFMSCEKWDDKFNACGGCPWQGQIHSPRDFLWGKTIQKTLRDTVKLVSPEDIRRYTFPRIKDRIDYFLREQGRVNLLVASPQGAGKSWKISDWAADYASKGKKVLIAVPTADLATEHANRIKARGEKAFVLMSHKNIFRKKKELGIKFDCPYSKEIQDLTFLGVPSSTAKEDYCEKCPFLEKCYYPRQYSEVMDEEYSIVIIQHAHLSCQEAIYEILKKQFDVMFIDESFLDSMYKAIKPHKYELEILKEHADTIKWSSKLSSWLKGESRAKGVINPDAKDMKKLLAKVGRDREWRLPEFIRLFNQGRSSCPFTGVEVVFDFPPIPIKVFTDATPPLKLLEHILGDQLEVWGHDELINIKKINSGNEVYQVLDTSASRSFLEKDANLENILHKIGGLLQGKYEGSQGLITVASHSMVDTVNQFFVDNLEEYPNTPTVGVMTKGTNKYEGFDIQFLLGGKYFLGEQFEKEVYKYKTIINYHRRRNGLSPLPNIYPYEVNKNTSVPIEKAPVKRIEYIDDDIGAGVYEYPQFHLYPPTNFWHNLVYLFNEAETQQAIRVRFKEKPIHMYILTNMNLPGTLVTRPMLLEDFLRGRED